VKSKSFITPLCVIAIFVGIFLRSADFGSNPISPYWEEVALGYDAYSILLTGADHHGNAWPLIAFESFGDWKPALYFYAVVPFVKLLGLSVEAVRMPSLLSGLLLIAVSGWLGQRLLKAGWLSAAIAALSPWGIHFSRGGWEAHLATALLAVGVAAWFEISASKRFINRLSWLLLSVLTFSLSMYAYHGARVVAPLLGIGLLLLTGWEVYRERFVLTMHHALAGSALALVVLSAVLFPFIQAVWTGELTQFTMRAQQTGMLAQNEVLAKNLKDQAESGLGMVGRFVYHRYFAIVRAVATEASSYANPTYLIVRGEDNPRHSTGIFGILYPHELLFLLIGLWAVWIRRQLRLWLLVFWIVAAIFVASMAVPNPHTLRTLLSFPAWILLIVLGLQTIGQSRMIEQLRKRVPLAQLALIGTVIVLYAMSVSVYGYHLLGIYPTESASHWQYGYEAIIKNVEEQRSQHPEATLIFSRAHGRPAMYWWFYTKTDPARVQAAQTPALKDQGEFLEFENIWFDFPRAPRQTELILAAPDSEIEGWVAEIETQYDVREVRSVQLNDTPWSVMYLEKQ